MTAVIYARYSSDNQREESIEGQIRECTAYAEKNGITVIKHYIDRAFSAKTDNRPEFQQMIKDSGKKLFDVVLVWKFDRFARNRFDSANYKMILKKNGVHLISVMEPIAEGSQGILVETLLEGMAEYYSAELSEKVIRGQTENALKGKCTGGTGTIGYKIDGDKFYHLDPLTSPLVLEAFQRYDNGDKMVEIVNFLNDKGVRNMLGGKMTHSSVNTMLKNRRYIGELSFRDIVVPEAIPVIVPKDLFDRVQKRMDKNKRAPACGKADEEYLLTTKLFCGKCGALMFGESGTSATGRTYYYYKCANVKRRKGCNKKTVQKDWLEDLVVRETMKLIQDDAVIDKIVQLVMDVQNQENTMIPLLEKQLREVNKKLDNLMKAIEDGLYTRTTKERLEALEIQKDELTAKIADEKLKKPSFNEDFIRFWLLKFRKFDISQKKQRKALIEIFVNAIFLYDDRMLITFNYKDGTQTVRFEDTLTADDTKEKSSDLSSLAGGEPLLIENEKVIDKILQFCKEHKTTVHITTNGSFLSYYLKKFIINRRFISGIYPTIDSMALNYMTRYDLDPSRNNTNETFKLLCCIKTLLHYGIHVDLGTNIDRHNHKEIWNTLDDLKKLQLLQDKNFAWTIGRVDDRLYETNFPDIMMESEILAELQSKPLPDNVHAAFLKTCYNFADKMGLKLNLREHKQTHSYCWSTSSSSNVFYVDMNLKTYRCTCTVGRSRYSLFDFSYENLTNYRPVAVTCNSYAECKDCKIGGFCGGGCQLSHQIDFKKCCTYEEEVFSHFMKTLFIPYIKSKYNEVNQNERKAENRCT